MTISARCSGSTSVSKTEGAGSIPAAGASHCPHCGALAEKPRSRPQHNRFFALADAAYMHWPESHWFKPKSLDHMRYWLTVQAGRFDVVKHIRVSSVEPDKLVSLLTAIMLASDDAKLFVEAEGDLITVKKAHSIKFKQMPQAEFSRLCDDVADVLKAEGFDPEQLLRETERAA